MSPSARIAHLTLLSLVVLLLGCERQPSTSSTAGTRSAAFPSAAPSSTPPEPLRTIAGIHYLEMLSGGAQTNDQLVMIMAIHGLGDRPRNFVGLYSGFPARARFIVPRGLDEFHGGYSWFPIDVRDPDPKDVAPGLTRAADALAKALPELTKRYATIGKPLVTGFSQGGMLSLALAVQHPDQIGGAFPLAGWLPKPLWPAQRAPKNAPPIFGLHGDADRVLPIEPTRKGFAHLRKLGYRTEFWEQGNVGHHVNPAMRATLFTRLAKAVAAAKTGPN